MRCTGLNFLCVRLRTLAAALGVIAMAQFAAAELHARACPPTPQARALEAARDPFGIHCMRVFQASYAQRACNAARSAIDLQECRYLSEKLIEGLRDCAAMGGTYGGRCAAMLPQARNMLANVNRNPILLDHREDQRARQGFGNSCRANNGVQCMGQCGGDANCAAACNSDSAWRCN